MLYLSKTQSPKIRISINIETSDPEIQLHSILRETVSGYVKRGYEIKAITLTRKDIEIQLWVSETSTIGGKYVAIRCSIEENIGIYECFDIATSIAERIYKLIETNTQNK